MTSSRGQQPQKPLWESDKKLLPPTGVCARHKIESHWSKLDGFEYPPSRDLSPKLSLPYDQLAELEPSTDILERNVQSIGPGGIAAPAFIELHA